MSDTPIYDTLQAEYAWREFTENLTEWQKAWIDSMTDSYRRVREVFDRASENITAYFTPVYVGGRAFGKRAGLTIVDESVEYDASAWALADATGWSPADAQAYLDKMKDTRDIAQEAVDWTFAAIKMPPKPPIWTAPHHPPKQLTHQRPQTRALGRTHYHGGRR